MVDAEAGRRAARDAAVTIVDGLAGYTYEFAPSPRAHADDYDRVEETIVAVIAQTRAEERAAWAASICRQSKRRGGHACTECLDTINARRAS